MKKFYCLALILFAVISALAQEKTISQAEFDSAGKNSFRWLAGQTYRETRIAKTTLITLPQTDNSALPTLPPRYTSIKSVVESGRGGFHSVYEFNSASVNKKQERIRIDGKTYLREGDGKWMEEILVPQPKLAGKTKTTDEQIEYKFLGNETVSNQNAVVYAKIETGKVTGLSNNFESLSTATTKFWFGDDGRLLKTERNQEFRNDKLVTTFQTVTTIELDPNIKIEIPYLN